MGTRKLYVSDRDVVADRILNCSKVLNDLFDSIRYNAQAPCDRSEGEYIMRTSVETGRPSAWLRATEESNAQSTSDDGRR